MMFSIILDGVKTRPGWYAGPQGLYTPGQRVSGKVVLKLDKDQEVPRVTIRFRGKIKTSITTGGSNQRRTRRHRCIIFQFEKQLFDGGGYKLRATDYEWPFSFTFPEGFNPGTCGLDTHTRGFVVGPQPLPPTCSTMSEMGRVAGSISYTLKARIPKSFIDAKTKVLLNFTPIRLEALPHSMHVPKQESNFVEHQQKYRFDAVGPRSLTTKESFSDKFHSHTETKIINFNVLISAPTQIVVGKPYPILVTLQSKTEEEIIPEFKLQSMEVHLKAYTQVRVDGTFGDHIDDTESQVPLLTSTAGLDVKLPVNEAIPVTGAFPSRIYAPPTFSTISMLRDYRLSIHVKVRCLDDTYKSSCRWHTVTLLPAKMEDGVEEAAEMIRSGNLQISDDSAPAAEQALFTDPPRINEDAPPPTYNEVQRSS